MTRKQAAILRRLKAEENRAWIDMQIASKEGNEATMYPAWSKASEAVRTFAASLPYGGR
jgi:hypothetical protein